MMMNKIIDMLKNDVVFGLIFIPSWIKMTIKNQIY